MLITFSYFRAGWRRVGPTGRARLGLARDSEYTQHILFTYNDCDRPNTNVIFKTKCTGAGCHCFTGHSWSNVLVTNNPATTAEQTLLSADYQR